MRKILFFVLILFTVNMVFSQPLTVSVSDFKVESDNPSHKYIGKGLARLIAGELKKSPGIELLERERTKEILEEQMFSLSDLADATQQVQIGKLLSARFIIFGEIINMGNTLLLSLRMVEVETGIVLWQEDITEKLETYDYITAYFAQSILTHLDIGVEDSTTQKITAKTEKNEEAIIKLSEGIDAYDREDFKTAREVLTTASQLDPENEVTGFYLAKLSALSPKFKVELEKYVPAYNPASLGFIKSHKLYLWQSSTAFVDWNANNLPPLGDNYYGYEFSRNLNVGYTFPLAEGFGLGIEYINSTFTQKLLIPDSTFFGPKSNNNGGVLSLGYAITESLSIGLSGLFYLTGETHEELDVDQTFYDYYGALSLGIISFLLNDFLTFDLQIVYTTQDQRYFDGELLEIVENAKYPLIIDNTLTLSFLNNTLFASLKGIEEIYLDNRGGYALRIIPIVEAYIFNNISIRGGYEFYYITQLGKSSQGHGFLAGLTARIWNFELNVNYGYRNKPIRILPGYSLPESNVLTGLVYHFK